VLRLIQIRGKPATNPSTGIYRDNILAIEGAIFDVMVSSTPFSAVEPEYSMKPWKEGQEITADTLETHAEQITKVVKDSPATY
jgi:hypothetical protein